MGGVRYLLQSSIVNRRLSISLVLLVLLLVVPGPASAFNHPERSWRVLDTTHVSVYYYDGVTETAALIAEAVEDVYPRLAQRYGRELPTRVRIVFDDSFDPLNGAAYHDFGLVQLEGISSFSEFRGAHDWVRDVLTHELAHLFSLRQTRMLGGLVPGMVVSALDGPAERPFQIATTFFLPSELSPRWFAEGIAQIDSVALGFDRWDGYRDMLLRTAHLEGGLFTFAAMSSLSDKNYLGAEKVYNQGFDLLRYVTEAYGPDAAARVATAAGTRITWNFEAAIESALGVTAETVVAAWKADRSARYTAWLEQWAEQLYEGEPFAQAGFLTRNVSVSPDGRRVAYTGNEGADFPTGDLYVREVTGGEPRVIFGDVGAPAAWVPDGSAVVVSADRELTWDGYAVRDLYRISIPGGQVTRLTHRARADDPAISADGRWLAAAAGRDGRMDLHLWPLQADGTLGAPRALTRFAPGIEVRRPRFSPDGSRIVFGLNVGQSSDLWTVEVTTGTLTPITQGPADDVQPVFLDERRIAYVSDERGAFDLYVLDLADRSRRRLTTTVGGVFDPAPAPGGWYYAVYHDGGFAVHRDARPVTLATEVGPLAPPDAAAFAQAVSTASRRYAFAQTGRRYVFDPLPVKAYPEFLLDDRSVRVGATVALSDVLSKHEFEVEALFGRDQDYHLGYVNRQWYPDFQIDVSRYVRRSEYVTGFGAGKMDFTFDVAMLAAVMPLGRTQAVMLAEVAKQIDFGYPVDRMLERGFEHMAQWMYYDLAPNADGDINPTGGRSIVLRGSNSWMRVFEIPPFGSVLDGREVRQRFWSGSLDYTEYLSLPADHTLELGLRLGAISQPVSLFDQMYLGGRIFFLRQGEFQTEKSFPGYEGFAIAGEKLGLLSAAWRFPLWQGQQPVGPLKLDSLFGQFFADAGNVLAHGQSWRDFLGASTLACPTARPCLLGEGVRTGLLADAGAELRLKTLLFEAFPWNSFARVAYGFHEPDPGRRWRAYVGLGIGY